jgi:hypothetical protein
MELKMQRKSILSFWPSKNSIFGRFPPFSRLCPTIIWTGPSSTFYPCTVVGPDTYDGRGVARVYVRGVPFRASSKRTRFFKIWIPNPVKGQTKILRMWHQRIEMTSYYILISKLPAQLYQPNTLQEVLSHSHWTEHVKGFLNQYSCAAGYIWFKCYSICTGRALILVPA